MFYQTLNLERTYQKMNNSEIRMMMKRRRVLQYEVAEKLGVSEGCFCRELRKELNGKRKAEVIAAIEAIAGENNA